MKKEFRAPACNFSYDSQSYKSQLSGKSTYGNTDCLKLSVYYCVQGGHTALFGFLWVFTSNIQEEKADHATYMEIVKWSQPRMI